MKFTDEELKALFHALIEAINNPAFVSDAEAARLAFRRLAQAILKELTARDVSTALVDWSNVAPE